MAETIADRLTAESVQAHLDNLTKPPGSLGDLERLACRLCAIQQTLQPVTSPRRLVIFAADHGVVASGVSAWPSQVTRLMIDNIRAGGAASSVLARRTGTQLVLVNVGTIGQQDSAKPTVAPSHENQSITYHEQPIRAGTRDLAQQPAMTVDEFHQAWEIGAKEARRAAEADVKVIAAGEMGIGNTTPAACLAMLLAGLPLERAVGRGAGADDLTLQHKRHVVQSAVERAAGRADDHLARISELAGLEIVAMAGLYHEAHRLGLTIILDGYVAGAAALIAQHQSAGVTAAMIAAHRSAEPGHGQVLEHLGLTPLLDWSMRLGEGTGALLLMPMLDAAAAIVAQMAAFDQLGVTKGVRR